MLVLRFLWGFFFFQMSASFFMEVSSNPSKSEAAIYGCLPS